MIPDRSPSHDDQDSREFVASLFSEAEKEQKKYRPRFDNYYKLLRNETWSEWRPSWLPSPSSSEIFPAFHSLIAWMTDSAPIGLVYPRPKPTMDQEWVRGRSEDMKRLFASWMQTQEIQKQLAMALWDTLTFGVGIVKSGFDPSMEMGRGTPTLDWVDLYNVYPDPAGSDEENIRYILEVRDASLYEIRSRFPERGRLVKPESKKPAGRPILKGPVVEPMANLASTGVTGEYPGTPTPGIPARYGPPAGTTQEDYTSSARLYEAWVKTTRRTSIPAISGGQQVGEVTYELPHWEFIAVAGNIVLTEEVTNPFDHGQHPYSRLPMVEMGDWYPASMSEHLMPIQIAHNRLLAALQINAELTGNPIFVEDERAGTAHTKLVARPGARITKNPGSEIGWLNPPTVSPLMRDLVFFYRDQIDRITGISAVARGENLRRREPGSAVDAVQEASFVRIRSIVGNMEKALRRAGEQVISNFVQFLTEPSAYPLVGPQGNAEALLLEPRHFHFPTQSLEGVSYDPLEFKLWIEAGSSLPTSRAVKASEYDQLYAMGLVGGQDVLDAHGVPNSVEVGQRGQDESLQRAFEAATQKGQGG